MEKEQQKFAYGPVEVRTPKLADPELIKRVPTFKESLRQCIYLSGLTAKRVAELLGIDQGHMSRIMSDTAHFPDDKVPDLMTLCGNYAPLQWLAAQMGFKLEKRSSKEIQIEELESKLNELRRSA